MAKILIVEDNDMLNTSYEMILTYNGYEVATAFDGQEGLVRAKDFRPDIILLDYFMPVMDGRQFLEAYKPARGSKAKVVLLTNIDDADKIEEAYRLGIDSYLLKANMTPDELVAHIRTRL